MRDQPQSPPPSAARPASPRGGEAASGEGDFAPIIKPVSVPGRTGKFYIREFDQDDADRYRAFMIARDEANPDAAARAAAAQIKAGDFILSLTICDAVGQKLFDSPAGLKRIRQLPARIASPLLLAASHLNLLFGAGAAEVKAAEDFFMLAQTWNSGLISPGTSSSPTSATVNAPSAQKDSSSGSPT